MLQRGHQAHHHELDNRKGLAMSRVSSLGFAKCLTALFVLAFAPDSIGHAQQLPITPGSTVRVSRADSAGQPFWSTGRVVYASRDRLLLAETDGDPLVRYNEALRLEVRRGERAMTGVVGGIGFGIGALTGVAALRAANRDDPDKPSFEPAIVGGVVGAVIGALVGSRIRIPRWEEVPLEDGQIAIAPLDETGTQTDFSLSRTVRWAQFEPTAADFQAFFHAHADNLHSVEGIWVRTGTQYGIAIVRVAGRDETFAAYRLRPDVGASHPSVDGVMLFALTPGGDDETDWRFQVARSSPRRHKATLDFGILRLEYPGGGIDQLERWFP